ncbi:very-long-chain (3R)-3-hydroxyacyl-CoA dehydratase 2 [Cephus cinctus]|uniref:Very-long-chain (3R)-3-hydroxyacyl-CoA dehydratase n=1 Tax=Cephus cinctus TaxID=211228 RepID=A0AAJ7R9J4_CEPCN|nr:very-long-chain (3R)-3-hydroxyacyl-CoA dehydratase 2 [Cephus cinctus]
MAGTTKGTKKKDTGILAKFYLCTYNLIEAIGWSYVLYSVTNYYTLSSSKASLWDTVKYSLIIFQNAAVLEIIHAATGLVPSNPVITMIQVFSRVMVVCGTLLAVPVNYTASCFGFTLILYAWSITEIIRYLYYFTNIIGFVPHILVWLRYTTFIALYPIGVTGELLCFYSAQKYASTHPDAWSYNMPNAWNFTFSYHYILIAVMLLYIPLFPQMYLHMFVQRRKILGSSSTVLSKKTL